MSTVSSNGSSKRARVVGELPPVPRISSHLGQNGGNGKDEADSSSGESEGPREPINTEGNGLGAVILEREFEDRKKKAELSASGEEESIEQLPDEAGV